MILSRSFFASIDAAIISGIFASPFTIALHSISTSGHLFPSARRRSTCVIALGLNRFEPRDYLSRTLALDVNGQTAEFCRQITTVNLSCRLDRLPCVMHTQNITLARDLVQLIFRSALRRHGETQPIEAWVVQPPNEVLQYLQAFLPGCTIREIHDFSDACKQTAAMYKTILGKPTSASKLLNWMTRAWDGSKISPHAIRD